MTRNRSKLENALNEWYNCLVETSLNELSKWYTLFFCKQPSC